MTLTNGLNRTRVELKFDSGGFFVPIIPCLNRTTDGGLSWVVQPGGRTYSLLAVSFSDTRTGAAVFKWVNSWR